MDLIEFFLIGRKQRKAKEMYLQLQKRWYLHEPPQWKNMY